MQQNNSKIPLLLIAIAFVVLVLGILAYLFYFKPYQEKQRIEIQNQNIEELYKDAFGDLSTQEEGKPLKELTEEERKLKETEIAYQNCYDKTEKLNEKINEETTNKYRIECGDQCYGDGRNWEFRLIDWLIREHPDFCNEFNTAKIKQFLDKKKEEFGNDFNNFKD